jgi:hypothetical protein
MSAATEARARQRLLVEYEYIWCRTFGHDWEEWHTDRTPEFGYYEAVHCPRCGTERLFNINMLGEVGSRRYVYPENYHLAFKVNRADLRRTMRKRGWWDETARKHVARAS